MRGQEALLARDVARAAAAWLNAPADYEAYRRLVVATRAWNAYFTPPLDAHDPAEPELFDELADQSPPEPLSRGVAELGERLRAQQWGQ